MGDRAGRWGVAFALMAGCAGDAARPPVPCIEGSCVSESSDGGAGVRTTGISADGGGAEGSTGGPGAVDGGSGSTWDPTPGSTGEPGDGVATDWEVTTGGPDGGIADVGSDFECSVWDQDCAAGFKCNAYVADGPEWDAVACFPVAPDPVAVGSACTTEFGQSSGLDDCDVGALCWGATCIGYCGGTPAAPSCAAGHACVVTNGGVLPLCLRECAPLVQDCVDGQACYHVNDAFVCATVSANGGPGDACSFTNDCGPGLSCEDGDELSACESESCCAEFCDPGQDTCDAPTSCELIAKGVGVCVG